MLDVHDVVVVVVIVVAGIAVPLHVDGIFFFFAFEGCPFTNECQTQ